MDLAARSLLAAYEETNADPDELQSVLAKNLNVIIAGPLIDTPARFQAVRLRPKTEELLKAKPQGQDLMRLNQMLLQDAYPNEIIPRPGQSLLYAAIVADTLEQAAQIERKVSHLPTVASVDGSDRGEAMFDLLTKDQTSEMQLVRDIKGRGFRAEICRGGHQRSGPARVKPHTCMARWAT